MTQFFGVAGFLLVLTFSQSFAEKIGIYHFNDISGQVERIRGNYDPTSDTYPEDCPNQPQGCKGGLELLDHYMNKSIPGVTRTYRLTPGNLVGGENGWLSVNAVGWKGYGKLLKYYKADVMGCGLKELEAGLSRTIDYFNGSHPLLPKVAISNVECSQTSGNEKIFCDWTERGVIQLEGHSKIGVIGFINPNADKLSSPGSLKFNDVVSSLKNAIGGLSQDIIVIGDGSLTLAQQIIDGIPQVKLVIYGRSFGPTNIQNYPMKYKDSYIATAGRYGSSIGQLTLELDPNQRILNVEGTLITPVHENNVPEILDISVMKHNASVENGIHVGTSMLPLEGGNRCWRGECNLGNLITDAMVHCTHNSSSAPVYAVFHSGAIYRDNITAGAAINKLDIHRWLPYHNRVYLTGIKGEHLQQLFAQSATGLVAGENDNYRDWGQFLQVSNGLEVWYRTDAGGPTVEKIRILDASDGRPTMKDLNPSTTYQIVIPSFIYEGRNLYDSAKNFWTSRPIDLGFDDDCLENYIRAQGKVTVGFEERIWINGRPCSDDDSSGGGGGNTAVTVTVTIVIMLVILAIIFVGYRYVYPRIAGRHPEGFRRDF